MEGYTYGETACCGPPREQYCCSPSEVMHSQGMNQDMDGSGYGSGYGGKSGYNNDGYNSQRSSFPWVILLVPLIFVVFICGVILCFYVYKKRIYEKVST